MDSTSISMTRLSLAILISFSLIWYWGYEVGLTHGESCAQDFETELGGNQTPCGEYIYDQRSSPVFPDEDDFQDGGWPFTTGEAGCEGWNACPCEEECENRVIASCGDGEF